VVNDNLVEYLVTFRRKHKKVVITPPHGMGKWKVEVPNKRASWYLTGAAVREALEKRYPPDLECTHADGHDPQTFWHGNVSVTVCRHCGNEVRPDDNLRLRAGWSIWGLPVRAARSPVQEVKGVSLLADTGTTQVPAPHIPFQQGLS
jgi:hypothetical protein